MTAAFAAFAWLGVLLQLYLSLRLAAANGKSIAGGILVFLGYFTILTNILVCVALIGGIHAGYKNEAILGYAHDFNKQWRAEGHPDYLLFNRRPGKAHDSFRKLQPQFRMVGSAAFFVDEVRQNLFARQLVLAPRVDRREIRRGTQRGDDNIAARNHSALRDSTHHVPRRDRTDA